MDAKGTEPQATAAPPGAGAEPFDPSEMKEKELARAAAIEATLRTQPRDRAWASATEGQRQTAVDALVKEGAAFSVKTLRCLTSVCEVVLSPSNPDQLRHAELRLAPRITDMSSFDIAAPETAADGNVTVTYRMFRKGYPRPGACTAIA